MSPISVSLEGATEALSLLTELIIPWRRKHAKVMEELENTYEKQVQAQQKLRATQSSSEASRLRAQAESIKSENERLQMELQRAKIQLALDIVAEVAPNLSEEEKIVYVTKLLPSLETLISSDIEITEEKEK